MLIFDRLLKKNYKLNKKCYCVCESQSETDEWVGLDDTGKKDKHSNDTFHT